MEEAALNVYHRSLGYCLTHILQLTFSMGEGRRDDDRKCKVIEITISGR